MTDTGLSEMPALALRMTVTHKRRQPTKNIVFTACEADERAGPRSRIFVQSQSMCKSQLLHFRLVRWHCSVQREEKRGNSVPLRP